MSPANGLKNANSPYLLQHAENPVDWHPWGPEAFALAKAENKPIFLSIGYSACHWCHVMAHESFEDPRIAQILREGFVSIKVDREEWPDVDRLYMQAVQIMTGHGGWPLSVFLTPDLEPFYGGTYWPPRSRQGMPGFDEILRAVSEAWQQRPHDVLRQGQHLAQMLQEEMRQAGPIPDRLSDRALGVADAALWQEFDSEEGGFGSAPKFPPAFSLCVLLRRWRRSGDGRAMSMVCRTLDRMAAGGMYDQLGGGFHRYSVDRHWRVPHFEKMLYDNAALAECYLEAWQATRHEPYARVVRETLDYVLRDMTGPEGGFFSAEDADSEGREGLFYLWTADEVASVLGIERAKAFCSFYHVTRPGQFEGCNILYRDPDGPEPDAALADDRARLLAVRARRVRPGCDDKVQVSWNALMIGALARAGAALDEPRYVEAARRAARFLLERVRTPDGRLAHYWRAGRAGGEAYLDDHAALALALVDLYEARFEEAWIDEAVALADRMLGQFADREAGGFFYAGPQHPPLLARQKDLFDSAVPSATGLAVTALLRLGRLCQRSDYLQAADETLRANMAWIERAPLGMGQMLLALDFHLGPLAEIVILSENASSVQGLLAPIRRVFLPNAVIAVRDAGTPASEHRAALQPAFQGKQPADGQPTLFLCEDFVCQAPIQGVEAIAATLARLAQKPAP